MSAGGFWRWLSKALPSTAGAPAGLTTPPEVTWSLADADPVAAVCPNCGAAGFKPQVLAVAFRALHLRRRRWVLLACPDCQCRFFIDASGAAAPDLVDYADDEMLTRGRATLYLQHGAGLAQLIRPIASLPHGPGARLLDIGCGFGFGLDFAVRARGWSGLGIDPAGIAAMGAKRLGLLIEQRLLGADEAGMRSAFDVVMAAETIEHVSDPAGFLRIVVSAMRDDGVLVLTTPDAAAIRPETPSGQLAGLLSPGLHVVLQSEHSLRRLLVEAGLSHLRFARDGGALVATASRMALPPQPDDAEIGRTLLAHLIARARDFRPDDDLFWGFAGRAFLEAVNAGAWSEASALRDTLAAACHRRFALDLDRPALFAETETCGLERMSALMPLNFGILLYADAMRRLGQSGARSGEVDRLAVAAEALRRLGRAVGELGMADPMSEVMAWAADAESLLCAASAPPEDFVDRLAALPAAPGEHCFGRREAVRLQAFVTLVNAARYDMARGLVDGCAEFGASRERQGEDAVYCRAILELQAGGDTMRAFDDFRWIRLQLTPSVRPECMAMFWSALRGETQALSLLHRGSEASALLDAITYAMAKRGEPIPPDLTRTCRPEHS